MGKKTDEAIAKLNKTYGLNTVNRVADMDVADIEFISTGSILIDKALGGGFAKGRIIEIYGPESSGKTTIALHAIAEVQSGGGEAAFVDMEHALDFIYARNLGINTDDLVFSQPENAEQAIEIIDALVKTGEVSLIVLDSVAAMIPKKELDGESGDSVVGLHARLMSQAMRKLTGVVSRSNCTLIFINQLREKVGILFGSPEVTTGGNALKFYASQRIDIRRTKTNKDKDGDSISNLVKVKIKKNKVAPPFKEAEVTIIYGKGISKVAEVLDIAVEMGLVEKSGSWFSYGETRLGQGREAVIEILEDNPELVDELLEKIKL